jgi:hypothetical protein
MSEDTENQHGYDGQERRQAHISEELFEKLATRAADIVEERIQLAVGKSAIKAAIYIVGAALVALAAWLGITHGPK